MAAIYDLHGNLPALEATLAAIGDQGVDRVVIGGDVSLGPMPRETLKLVSELQAPVDFVRGNCDAAVLAAMGEADAPRVLPPAVQSSVDWVAGRLDPGHARLMAAWPQTVRLSIRGLGEVLFCHATPRDDDEIFTRETAEERLLPAFEGVEAELVVCGHTHMPFDRRVGRLRVVNAGSVGTPFGEPGAHWLLLGPGVELRRTAYDLEAAAERIAATDYPDASSFAASVLEPRSEEEMLAAFAEAELG